MPAAPEPGLPYAPALDGLRAISVLAVILWHANPASDLMSGGFLGVEVFFVLSGYLITSLLLAEWRTRGRVSLRRFYRRRARRLLPALFVLLAVVSAYSILFLRSDSRSLGTDVVAALTYTTNWSLIVRRVSYTAALGRPPLLQHLWSLAVEEQFYLLWPILFVGLMRVARGRRAVMFAAIVAMATLSAISMATLYDPFRDPSRVYFGTDTRACGLLLGAAFALVWRPGGWSARTGRCAPILLDAVGLAGLVGLGAFFLRAHWFDAALYHGAFVLVALLTLAVIGAAVHPAARGVRGLLGRRTLVWIGVRSYGLYLWHWPIFMVTRPRVDVPIVGLPLLVLRFGLTTIAAALSYRYVEQPIRSGGIARVHANMRATTDAWGAERLRRRVQAGTVMGIVIVFALGDGLVSLSGGPGRPAWSSAAPPAARPTSTISVARPTATVPFPNAPLPRRVVIVGDSVGHFAYANRPDGLAPYLALTDGSTEGCGIAEGRMGSEIGYRRDLGAECHGWEAKWTDAALAARAQIALVFIGAWEVFDLEVDNRTLSFGSAAWDRYFDAQLRKGIRAIESAGAKVALAELPCWRPVDNGSGTTAFPERGDDRRTRHLNALLEHAAGADPRHVTALRAPAAYCTDNSVATSLAERWDGVHYGRAGAARLFTALVPQLLAIRVTRREQPS